MQVAGPCGRLAVLHRHLGALALGGQC
eukprot:SAG11_NODE_23173_length_393_cov_8.023810_1_plen_26_part_01